MLYDTLILLGIWILTIVILVRIWNDVVYGAWVQSILFTETLTFFVYFWVWRGQTAGMVAWRLQLRANQPFRLKHALLRFLGGMASIATLGLGFVWQLFDENRRSWPDLLSGTQVIRLPKVDKSVDAPQQQG